MGKVSKDIFDNSDLISIRQFLHQNPELSHQENNTAKYIETIISKYQPDTVLHIPSTSIAFIFNDNPNLKSIVIRAELDALPIVEQSDLPYKSNRKSISHVCGHDGHMTILIGLAKWIYESGYSDARITLLFQEGEETGQGATMVVGSKLFREIKADYIFALHNLPGYPLHQIVVKEGFFNAGSVGIDLNFTGKSTHAAYPENGINPDLAVAEMIQYFSELSKVKTEGFITTIQVQLGERAFGTAASKAILSGTIRAFSNQKMDELLDSVTSKAEAISKKYELHSKFSTTEKFSAVENHDDAVQHILKAAQDNKFDIFQPDVPFRWSEDFAEYCKKYNSALFCIGSGINHPQLHNNHYDFRDELIQTGIVMFKSIIENITKINNP